MQLYRVEPIGASLQAADVANADSVVLNAVYIHWRGQGQVFLAVISRRNIFFNVGCVILRVMFCVDQRGDMSFLKRT